MEKNFISYILNCSLEGLKYQYKIQNGLEQVLGDFDSEYFNLIGDNFINIAWQTIIEARNIPEIDSNEFECFSDIMYEIAWRGISSFYWEGIEYTFQKGEDIWEYFNGSHIDDFIYPDPEEDIKEYFLNKERF